MSWFRTIAGLRTSVAVYAVLLTAATVLWVLDPADWVRHTLVTVSLAVGLVLTLARLRSARRAGAPDLSAATD